MRVGQANIARFFLQSPSKNNGKRVQVEDIEDFDTQFADVFKKDEGGNYFKAEKQSRIDLGETAYEYLLGVFAVNGVRSRVRLLTEVKDETKETEDWTLISDVGVDLKTLQFDDVTKEVSFETIQGGFMETLEARWDDDYDITADGLPTLDYVNILLEPRKIISRTNFIPLEVEVDFRDDQGSTARAIPLDFRYRSLPSFIASVSNVLANSVNDTYAKLSTSGNCFITNAPENFTFTFNGTIAIQITNIAFSGSIQMDLVRFNNAEEQDFDEIILTLDTGDPTTTDLLTYTFNDYKVNVNKGDSIALMTLSNVATVSGSPTYITHESTDFIIETDDTKPATYTKGIKVKTAFQGVVDAIGEDVRVDCPSFDDSGGYTDVGEVLLVHGTWIRNMPLILNEGQDDERRIQANLSLKELYQALKIQKPLWREPRVDKKQDVLYIGLEKETQQNFIGAKLKDGNDYIPIINAKRKVIGKNFYGKITLGSTKSGENYEEINNIYSICGNASWNTINKDSEETYEVTTEFRTGAEDFETTRFVQYEENPDFDTDRDDDWFFIHCKKVGSEYHTVEWQDLYTVKPKNVYDADSNYNWIFRPRNLLEGHGWKIKSCLNEKVVDFLTFNRSNCNSSLITQRVGEQERPENGKVFHNQLEKATVRLMEIDFEMVVRQSIIKQLQGDTNGLKNLYGLIAYQYEGFLYYGRLMEANTNKDGNFKLVEAIRT